MLNKKKIVFLTGTRADFGKLKSLIEVLLPHESVERVRSNVVLETLKQGGRLPL